MYHEIQKRHTSGDSYSKIAADLGLDRRTVKRYAQLEEKEFEAFLRGQAERRKLLAPYEEFVKKRLSDFPSASTAQVHDWLKEHGHMEALASVLHQCQQKQLYCAMAFKSLLNARLKQPQTLPEGKQIKLDNPAQADPLNRAGISSGQVRLQPVFTCQSGRC